MTRRACVVVMTVLTVLAVSAQEPPPADDPVEKGLWEQILELYETAKESGQQVPKDAWAWVREDVQSFGDWEYRVLELPSSSDPAAIETRLNELGTDRWECLWIQPLGSKTRFFLKRPHRSYLQQIPLNQLLKLLPQGSSD